jgi:hypothetical protein
MKIPPCLIDMENPFKKKLDKDRNSEPLRVGVHDTIKSGIVGRRISKLVFYGQSPGATERKMAGKIT